MGVRVSRRFSAVTHINSMVYVFSRVIPSKKKAADSILSFRNNITIVLAWYYGVFQKRHIYAVGPSSGESDINSSLSGSANHGIPAENRRHTPVRQAAVQVGHPRNHGRAVHQGRRLRVQGQRATVTIPAEHGVRPVRRVRNGPPLERYAGELRAALQKAHRQCPAARPQRDRTAAAPTQSQAAFRPCRTRYLSPRFLSPPDNARITGSMPSGCTGCSGTWCAVVEQRRCAFCRCFCRGWEV